MKKAASLKELYQLALGYLAKREHSTQELIQKLKSKTDYPERIFEVVSLLTEKNVLSDVRFAENYIRMRTRRGYGKLRIQAELKERGVLVDLEDPRFCEEDTLRKVRGKKFGTPLPHTSQEKAKQGRYLYYKGFSFDEIKKVLHHDDDE